jgi:hypothetical protein
MIMGKVSGRLAVSDFTIFEASSHMYSRQTFPIPFRFTREAIHVKLFIYIYIYLLNFVRLQLFHDTT